MLNYKVQAENDSLYNTPNTFGIYILGLTMKWLQSQGGLEADGEGEPAEGRQAVRRNRSHRLLSRHGAQKDSRSLMNITFRLPTEELEKMFVKESTAAGLDGLKGHRSVGGMRASIYNAFPEEGVDALVSTSCRNSSARAGRPRSSTYGPRWTVRGAVAGVVAACGAGGGASARLLARLRTFSPLR